MSGYFYGVTHVISGFEFYIRGKKDALELGFTHSKVSEYSKIPGRVYRGFTFRRITRLESQRMLGLKHKHNLTVFRRKDHPVCRSYCCSVSHHFSGKSLIRTMSAGNNISVVTPEFDTMGQILFRDSNQRMIEGKQVLILTDSVTTGALLAKAVEAVLYYGGRVCGICAVFSAVNRAAGMDVRSIFTVSDLPDYKGYAAKDCPLCREGQKLDGIVNTFGLVKF